ncbi:MAG: cysteine--tRNA ligase, partial [Lachnospiraceae bacterium]|nr:cysteine--tRNA ligase [Lachnospiraceae bacterium]
DKGKMSKSSGEFLTVSLLEDKGYDPLAYRYFCLQSHYRKPLEFSYEVLDQMSDAYKKLRKRTSELSSDGEADEKVFEEYRKKFEEALTDDLNTSSAFTVLYDALKADVNDATKRKIVESFDEVLSLKLLEPLAAGEVDAELEAFVLAKIEERTQAKKDKDFAKADAIREELLAKGITIKDTREGVKWEKI